MQLSRTQLGLVIAVGVLVTFLASAIKGSYQVYFVDLVEQFGIGRGHFALTGAVFGLSIGLVSPLVGWVCDRFGAIQTILSGAVTTALVFAALAYVQWFPLFLFLYGLMAAYALAAMTFVPLGLLVDRVFAHENKGMAFAAITNGTAIGFMVLSPMWVWFNEFLSWTQVCLLIAALFFLVVVPAVLGLQRTLPAIKPAHGSDEDSSEDGVRDEMLKPAFLLLAISFAGCGASMAYIDVHLVPMMQQVLEGSVHKTEVIASSLSILGAAELIGAFVVGWLLRYFKPGLFLAGLYGLRAASMFLIVQTESAWVFWTFAVMFGLTYMGTVIITSMLCLKVYGEKIKGKMFGFLFTIHQVAVFATIWSGGVAFDLTGSYQGVTIGVALFCCFSSITGLLLHGWHKRELQHIGQQPA
ncbi:MFS transporter [Bacterioplanes sanyensis]|uniref:MFS transporter n=1 Tax=Bacterioplanes sanyensis TaxID=1249553 RepID=A0A222FFY3_9GAMM|nr:MFS transporter [Bacterioplanes sanyensis]ASP37542.1 MFS transporter [Bacterioplanes sanyensis]